MKIFMALLFFYFVIVIANVVVGRVFLDKIRQFRNDLWIAWGSPSSVFAFKKKNIDLYKFVFQAKKHDFDDSHGLYGITKAMAFTTALSQLGFVAALAAFLVVAFVARTTA